jgi:DNA invertase Pin-like site-specific DNA recombinase
MDRRDDNMGKVYAYCRVAREENCNLDKQYEEAENYCKNNSLILEKIWSDIGSGLDQGRISLNSMLNVLQNGDIVIVKDIARLSRDVGGYEKIISTITDKGANVEFVEQYAHLDNLGLWISEWFEKRFK